MQALHFDELRSTKIVCLMSITIFVSLGEVTV
ncbi:MAG: hypothetical protein UT13_C0001G0692 [Candidatus Pacebacteria bacterium GW2011_GWF2_38_9]|nr:MAG: hypothetical protein US01_C0001G0723 [candidate division TM6 bacterium GW2011_GWF2_28_16]KKQ10088.1 MAG: hypothetical protein US20_C0003G0028 [Candidatus Pacebacteria bacterium GW2011_GWF1_36_5]KKQ89044.1 MAG: hypothetical protein UT13_C0001G0692 [Candidatus Pacebacteria bacterium GW2011_GWF2_38_9]